MTFSPFPQRSSTQTYLIDEAIRELESMRVVKESSFNTLQIVSKKIDSGNMHMTALQIWNMAADEKRHINMINRIVKGLEAKRAL